MQTHCNANQFSFQGFHGRDVCASFDGGHITSDAGGLLLREVEQGQQFIEKFSQCFTDLRNPRFTEHTVTELLSQRVYGLCFGNEDLNDHDQLRSRSASGAAVREEGSGRQSPAGTSVIAANPWQERAH